VENSKKIEKVLDAVEMYKAGKVPLSYVKGYLMGMFPEEKKVEKK
jgi:hypothetical protein